MYMILMLCMQVPNVKFNVAKMLARIAPLLDRPVIERSIRPCLTELCDDADMDVRFYAKQALYAADGTAAA
jgi:serine/threonine-protein phosphatase 2A regulatory subunit A